MTPIQVSFRYQTWKPYLKLSWSALDHYQVGFFFLSHFEAGFFEVWITLIRTCIYMSRGSVLINRAPSGFFKAKCGLCKWYTISPYLFCLPEEVLSYNNMDLNNLISNIAIKASHKSNRREQIRTFPFVEEILTSMQASFRDVQALKPMNSR